MLAFAIKCLKEATSMSKEIEILKSKFEEYKKLNLSLNMKRGVPCKEQLDLSMDSFEVLTKKSNFLSASGIDCRSYGELTGIPECKKLLSDTIEVPDDQIIIFGNSSLNVMFDVISHAYIHGIFGNKPWSKYHKIKWLCPVPGYDRHFAICEYFNMEMINIPMNENGPDMDLIEKLVQKDKNIKGIWCVPKYSNPNGITYSDDVVKRFANLKPKAKDFRIFWDNAYSVHHLYDDNQDFLLEILAECEKANNPDIVYKFTSTSKISFPGSGIAALASSKANLKDIEKALSIQTIGHDKLNQLRHVLFFKDINGIKKHMKKHADIIRPKFELVESILSNNISDFASWNNPKGGYFISLDTKFPIAKEVIKRCEDVGVYFTPAGSSFPYHKDPNNTNIRLAPTYPSIKDLEIAINVLCDAIKLESLIYKQKLLQSK